MWSGVVLNYKLFLINKIIWAKKCDTKVEINVWKLNGKGVNFVVGEIGFNVGKDDEIREIDAVGSLCNCCLAI